MSPGRNDPCPCASGKRFKHCCGRAPGAAPLTVPPDPREIAALLSMVSEGQLRQAEERASALLDGQPAAGILWKVLSVAVLRQGREALPALQRAAELLPQDAEAHANLGAELHLRGQWQAALACLRHSLMLQPRNLDALVLAADTQRALGAPRAAVTLYEEALQLDPGRRDAHNNLGNAWLELGQPAEAVRCYRRALQLRPDDGQVQCNLGNALRQIGELEESLWCTRRALALLPTLAMAHNNLGLLLVARGQQEEAVTSYREALRLNPRYVEALNNLGNLLRGQGERREALRLYQEAVQSDPRHADSHCNLGHALLDARRPLQAIASFRRTLELQGDNARAHLGLAAALRVQGLFAEAQASCEAALAAEPGNPRALAFLGELRADGGHAAAAEELFARALELDPACVGAYVGIAAHRGLTGSDTAWLEGAQRLLAKPLPLEEQIHLRYALGKYFDDVADYEQAFSSYQAANELTKRYGAAYDRERLSRLVDRVIGRCDAGFVRAHRGAASASDLPVFIFGMPRSGTPLAEQILAAHPAVFSAGAVRFFDRAFAQLEQAGRDSGGVAETLAGMAAVYLARVTARAGDALRITDNMPANFLYAGLIHAVFPQARLIHIQRHPLDACLSVYFQNFFNVSPYANDLQDLAHYYGEYQRLSAHWRTVLPAGTLLEVPYEGLVADSESWTRRMLEFIALPWEARCLEFRESGRAVTTSGQWQVRQAFSAAAVGHWRHYQRHLGPLQHLTAQPSMALPMLNPAGEG
jgi:tetratricopeptide (TPR) repeat protein